MPKEEIREIKKILIANRSEIAVRIIRACREMDIKTVAIYSEVDAAALHVLLADQAVNIGAAAPAESYLNTEKIIRAAQDNNCDAIHPGYGFHSEHGGFARKCREAGIIFIGPSPEAMEMVGDKLTARKTMLDAGIPLTPGMKLEGMDKKTIAKKATEIGYPVMVKASAGGGGKGMRIVHEADDLHAAIDASAREAQAAFGDGTVYMEKFIEKPRHIEFQVIADNYGNTVHLFERECSIQRRHQKIVEESPSPVLTEDLRREMGETACRVMEAVDYSNAGTVEFLLDQDNKYYFLEVNARIQVEHPVTEMVTGIDLVKQQIKIATGKKLPFTQEDLSQRGHAIECRIYAEDPQNNFFPSIGKLLFVKEPQGPGIRCDSSIYSGLEVNMHYDPILSKLIVWAEDRPAAIRKMITALQEYVILGIQSPVPFLKDVVEHPVFASGDLHTGFIAEHFPSWQPKSADGLLKMALTAAAAVKPAKDKASRGEKDSPETPWQSIGDWQLLS